MKPGKSSTRPSSASRLSAVCLVLYWTLVLPLFVACFPGGGTVAIELVGKDPCHRAWQQQIAAHRFVPGPRPVLALGDPPDPCLDVSLIKPALSTVIADAVPARAESMASPPDSSPGLVCDPEEVLCRWKPPGPSEPIPGPARSYSPLLI